MGRTSYCLTLRGLQCPTIHFPPKKTTTRCFVDDHEVRHGFSFHRRLIAVAPSPPWTFTGDHFGSSVERPKMDMSRKSPSKRTSPSLDDGGGDRKEGGDGGNGGDGGGVNDDDQYRFDDEDDNDDDRAGLFGVRFWFRRCLIV